MNAVPLKAVTLTHVRYRKGDQLGHFLGWVSLVPVFISLGGFVSHFIFRRELQGIFFGIGLIISQFINELIKKNVQQARPETCALLEMCDSHGWPSSHSQYMFFFAVYFSLLNCKGIGPWGIKNRWIMNVLNWSLAVLTMYSRVYLGYHTVAQVFAGATLGILVGAAWFWVVNSVLFSYFPAIEESALGSLSMTMPELLGTRLVRPIELIYEGPSELIALNLYIAWIDDLINQMPFLSETSYMNLPERTSFGVYTALQLQIQLRLILCRGFYLMKRTVIDNSKSRYFSFSKPQHIIYFLSETTWVIYTLKLTNLITRFVLSLLSKSIFEFVVLEILSLICYHELLSEVD